MTEEITELNEPLPNKQIDPPPASSNNRALNIVKIITLISGGGITLFGMLVAVGLGVALTFTPTEVTSADTIVVLGLLIISLLFGGGLTLQAWQSLQKSPSAKFYLPPVWLLLLIYVIVLLVGQTVLIIDRWPNLLFPPFHIVGAIFPILFILGIVSQVLKNHNVTWRDITLNITGGLFIAPFIAILVELIAGILIFVIAIIGMMAIPGGEADLEAWISLTQDPFALENPNNFSTLITFPPLMIAIAAVFVIIGPTIEELTKPVVIYGLSYRRPTKAQAWLWGLAGGAGFALLENIFNTLAGLDAWVVIMLVRIGASLMHCLGSGLIALGWQHMLETKRPWYLLGAIVTSIGIHALWNGTLVTMIGAGLLMPAEFMPLIGVGVVVAGLFMFALTIGMFGALVGITVQLTKSSPTFENQPT